MRPTVLDLFAGIGCWSVGFECAGCKTIAACELDPWKRKWLAREFPQARIYDNVRQLTGKRLAADGIVPDIIVGSPPCKEYSSANSKRRGLDGDDLFLEFVRLVGECGPDWACAENSPNIRTRGFDRIAREFERAGYESRAFVLGADDLGAPHIRKRAWIIANCAEDGSWRAGRSDSGGARQQDELGAWSARDAANAVEARREAGRCKKGQSGEDQGWRCIEPERPAGAAYAAHADQNRSGFTFEIFGKDAGDAAGEQVGRAGQPREDDRLCAAGDADRCDGDALGQSLGGYARPELAALGRAIGPAGLAWGGGPGLCFELAHGHIARCDSPRARRLLDREFRRIAAAAGDAILSEIAYLLAKSILSVEGTL